jgi:branched-chain amino acid transport system ATP-binding protein
MSGVNVEDIQPALLDVQGVTMHFGGLTALAGVDLTVRRGEIQGVIGPNGSGKTTLFNVITGFYRPAEGRIRFKGRDITGLRPDLVAREGLARTFQNLKLFHDMTVEENLLVGRHIRARAEFLAAVLRPGWVVREEDDCRARVGEILQLLGLMERRDEVTKSLSYGQQRLVELGRALAMDPDLLLLDEPTAGLNEAETLSLMESVNGLRARGYTILLVEHDMRLVMGVCDQITVLDHGRKIAAGTAREVQENPAVIAAYLGSGKIVKRRKRQETGDA